MEGETENIIVQLNYQADRQVTVTLNRMSGTADGWLLFCFVGIHLI